MATTTLSKCDLCGATLHENEMQIKTSLIMIGTNKPISKSSIVFICDGSRKSGDLCLKCAIKLRDFIEKLKMESSK